jgi:hypothetical protein
MMNLTTIEINELALEAQADLLNGKSTNERRSANVWNLIAVFTDKINKLERIHGNNFNDEIAFVERCEKKIEYAAKAFDPNIRDFGALATRTLNQAVKDFYKNRTSYKSTHDSFEYLTNGDDDSERAPYYIESSENIERELVSNEFYIEVIDEYGKDDKRKYILNRWSEEGRSIKNTELAREMVDIFGGTENSHVQFIKRLRTNLRKQLGEAIA